jgi:CRISPR/Cas system-associated endonuclease/helicase Cas3
VIAEHYGAHQRNSSVVADIKARLQEGKPCHVSSTQVIEAGVDLDFPDVLLREKAPLDSLLQAFGRCNRNGNKVSQSTLNSETMTLCL